MFARQRGMPTLGLLVPVQGDAIVATGSTSSATQTAHRAYANIGAALRQVFPGDVDGWMLRTTSVPPRRELRSHLRIAGAGGSESGGSSVAPPCSPAHWRRWHLRRPKCQSNRQPNGDAVADVPRPPPQPSRTPAAARTSPCGVHGCASLDTGGAFTDGDGDPPRRRPTPAPTEVRSTLAAASDVEEPSKPSGYLAFVAVLGRSEASLCCCAVSARDLEAWPCSIGLSTAGARFLRWAIYGHRRRSLGSWRSFILSFCPRLLRLAGRPMPSIRPSSSGCWVGFRSSRCCSRAQGDATSDTKRTALLGVLVG